MPEIKKNKKKAIRGKKHPDVKPVYLPRDPREAKKLAEINAMLENAIFLPSRKGDV